MRSTRNPCAPRRHSGAALGRAARVPYLTLLRKGLALPPALARRRGGLLHRLFTLACGGPQAVCFCGAFRTRRLPPRLRPFGRISCPAESGLSSPHSRRDRSRGREPSKIRIPAACRVSCRTSCRPRVPFRAGPSAPRKGAARDGSLRKRTRGSVARRPASV